MAKKCTWALESYGEDDELIAQKACGQKIVLTFIDPRRGRPDRPAVTYPRCKRHAPPAAISMAYKMGYRVEPEEEYEIPDTAKLD